MLEKLIIVILAIALTLAVFYIILVKIQMKKTREELKSSREEGYNKLVTAELVDKDQEKLLAEINKNLEYQNKKKIQAEGERAKLKQSISDIAHDLRTPVTVIRGNLQMIEKSGVLKDGEAEELRICLEKSNDLKMMVDEFYELSYFESEDVALSTERIDVTDFVANFIIDNEALFRKKDYEPRVVLPDKSIFIDADPALLRRILSNLLTNVLRYSKEYLLIEVKENEGNVEISMENESSEEIIDVDRIFDRTYRADKVRTNGGPGGLGLYIVKILSEKMNGRVFAANEDNAFRIGVSFNELKD